MEVGDPSKSSTDAAPGQPTSADESSSGASGTGSRTPATVNHSSPSHTCTSPSVRDTPSSSAASAPSTTAGNAPSASSSHRPDATVALTVVSRSVRAALTAIALVWFGSISSVRYTAVSGTMPTALTALTSASRATMSTLSGGSDASPTKDWPGATV